LPMQLLTLFIFDDTVKSRNPRLPVIPAKDGIPYFQLLLDPGLRPGDGKKVFCIPIIFRFEI
jgi:hypothetical protein